MTRISFEFICEILHSRAHFQNMRSSALCQSGCRLFSQKLPQSFAKTCPISQDRMSSRRSLNDNSFAFESYCTQILLPEIFHQLPEEQQVDSKTVTRRGEFFYSKRRHILKSLELHYDIVTVSLTKQYSS